MTLPHFPGTRWGCNISPAATMIWLRYLKTVIWYQPKLWKKSAADLPVKGISVLFFPAWKHIACACLAFLWVLLLDLVFPYTVWSFTCIPYFSFPFPVKFHAKWKNFDTDSAVLGETWKCWLASGLSGHLNLWYGMQAWVHILPSLCYYLIVLSRVGLNISKVFCSSLHVIYLSACGTEVSV